MWRCFVGYILAAVPKAVQAVQELLMTLEAEGTTFLPNIGIHTPTQRCIPENRNPVNSEAVQLHDIRFFT
jgi:hypothetical protein